KLTIVLGFVSSGKSTLLAALPGDIQPSGGNIYFEEKTLVAQKPWTMTGSIRDNIMKRYFQVLNACCLEEDISSMSEEDETWVTSKGENLSGGQRQRISVARFIYSNADVVIIVSILIFFNFCFQSELQLPCDAADAEMIELVEMELRELMSSMGYDGDNIPMVKGSALCALEGTNPGLGENAIMELLAQVDSYIPQPVRDLDKPFLLPVESVYSIPGRGTVVTGRLERGVIKKGMEAEFLGFGKQFKSVITGVEMFRQILDEAQAGDQIGALVRGLKRDDVKRGMFMGKPGTLKVQDHFESQVYVLNKDEGGRQRPITTYNQVNMFSKTWTITCEINLPDKELVMPGEDARIEMKLQKPCVMEQGQRFTIRDGSTTIGTGVVTKILPRLSEMERKLLVEGKKFREKFLASQKEKEAKK
ncbi:hypothetical protein QYM36_014285, partial [Artemia franciscana]